VLGNARPFKNTNADALALARFQKGSDARSDLSLFYAQLVGFHLSARSQNASTHRAFKAAGHREAAIAA
jgi:hypothetical protein